MSEKLKVGDNVLIGNDDSGEIVFIAEEPNYAGDIYLVKYYDFEDDLVYEMFSEEELTKTNNYKYKPGDILEFINIFQEKRRVKILKNIVDCFGDKVYLVRFEDGEERQIDKENIEHDTYELIWRDK